MIEFSRGSIPFKSMSKHKPSTSKSKPPKNRARVPKTIDEHASLLDQVRTGRERSQRLARQLLQAQEMERRRFARELHDEIGQALTAVMLNLQALHSRLPAKLSKRLTRAWPL